MIEWWKGRNVPFNEWAARQHGTADPKVLLSRMLAAQTLARIEQESRVERFYQLRECFGVMWTVGR